MTTSDTAPGVWRNVRSMPPAAWVLFGGTFVNRFGSFVLIFLVIWLTEEGYSAAQAGAAVRSYGVGALAASLLGGYLADRIGRRNAIPLDALGGRDDAGPLPGGNASGRPPALGARGADLGALSPRGRGAPRRPHPARAPPHRLRALPPRHQPGLRRRAGSRGSAGGAILLPALRGRGRVLGDLRAGGALLPSPGNALDAGGGAAG